MPASGPLFTPDEIRAVLIEVGQRLAAQRMRGTVVIAGGSFLALNGWRAEGTRDVDAVTRLDDAVRAAAAEVAGVHGFTLDWLNDRALAFVPATFDVEQCAVLIDSAAAAVEAFRQAYPMEPDDPYLVDFVAEIALSARR